MVPKTNASTNSAIPARWAAVCHNVQKGSSTPFRCLSFRPDFSCQPGWAEGGPARFRDRPTDFRNTKASRIQGRQRRSAPSSSLITDPLSYGRFTLTRGCIDIIYNTAWRAHDGAGTAARSRRITHRRKAAGGCLHQKHTNWSQIMHESPQSGHFTGLHCV